MSVRFDKLYKNEHLKDYFSAVIEGSGMPHAIILEGAKGSGKTTLALEIAKAMSCSSVLRPCGICDSCRKIDSSVYADVMIYDLPEGKNIIPVDTVRQIKANALSVPVEGEYKFFIIRNSDRMNVQAQNALLKILEEPKPFVVFMLLCCSSSLLLPTVVSRAPVFRMQRFTDKELEEYFELYSPDSLRSLAGDRELLSLIFKSSGGCIGEVLSSKDKRTAGGSLKRYQRLDDFFSALTAADKSAFIAFESDINAKKREDFASYINDVKLALRDILAVKAGYEDELLYFVDNKRARELGVSLTLEGITGMISLCDSALSSNDLNANLNLLKINFMSGIWNYSCL